MRTLTYEDFTPDEDVRVYKAVKNRTMLIADAGRDLAAEMVGGTVGDGKRSAKEFVHTEKGLYRLSLGSNADNTTERAAHRRMGAKPVVMGDEAQLRWFFNVHGLDDHAYEHWLTSLRVRFHK